MVIIREVYAHAAKLEGRTWRVDPPMTRAEVIARVVGSAQSRNPAERGYIARALAKAGPAILAQPPVQQAILSLRTDDGEAIRNAAAAIRLPSGLHGWVARKLWRE